MKPMKHQLVSLAHSRKNKRVFDCSDPGTGKTAVRIWSYIERRKKSRHKAIVVCTTSSMTSVWADEFRKIDPTIKTLVADAKTRKTKAFFDADADVVIINHDGVRDLKQMKPVWFRKFAELIVDESTAFKHHTSQRTKMLFKISKTMEFVSAMTGTPNGRTVLDLWAQVYIVDGGAHLGHSFYAFRNTVCVPEQVGNRPEMVQWTDRDGAVEAVFDLLRDIVVRHKFEDCTDIPKQHVYTRGYDLGVNAFTKYCDMHDLLVIEARDAKGNNRFVSAVHASARVTKMLQIASGAVYTGDKDDEYILIDDGRYKFIADLAEESHASIVFFYWRHQRDLLLKELAARSLTSSYIDGTVPDKARPAIVSAYQNSKLDVLLLHPQAAAHALTLTHGQRTIWSGPTQNVEWFVQGNRRQYRLSQKKKTESIVVIANGTREEDVYETFMVRNGNMNNLLDLFDKTTKEMKVRK